MKTGISGYWGPTKDVPYRAEGNTGLIAILFDVVRINE